MENLKIFLFLYSPVHLEKVKERREKQQILRYYVDNKKRKIPYV